MQNNLDKLVGFVIDHKFSSYEEMVEMSKLWDLEHIQTEKGSFTGYIHATHTPHIQIAEAFRSPGVMIRGKTPANTYVFAYISGTGELTQGGIPLKSNELFVLNDNDEFYFTSHGPSVAVSIAIEKTFFEKVYKMLFGLPFLYKGNNQRFALKDNNDSSIKNVFEHWRKYLIENKDEWINDKALTKEIEKNIIATLCSYMGVDKGHKLISSEKNAIALHHYINKNYTKKITIKEICATLDISERSVRPSFKKIFGLNPKEYLSRFRLGKFRNSLIKNIDNPIHISKLGYNEGLFHTNHFPKEYKEMFGYLPSEMQSKKETDS